MDSFQLVYLKAHGKSVTKITNWK